MACQSSSARLKKAAISAADGNSIDESGRLSGLFTRVVAALSDLALAPDPYSLRSSATNARWNGGIFDRRSRVGPVAAAA
jgi:hypothetical protein